VGVGTGGIVVQSGEERTKLKRKNWRKRRRSRNNEIRCD
jgi:hypothetical protein